MVNSVSTILDHVVPDLAARHLVSGGAAWADHVAVSLFLMDRAPKLTVYMPCQFREGLFQGNKDADTATYYHKLFSEKVGKDTRQGIERARSQGAEIVENLGGFFARNRQVADCDVMVAMTWGDGDTPKDGGTANTWKSSLAAQKFHIPLALIAQYEDGTDRT
jgi:hypothetical protein